MSAEFQNTSVALSNRTLIVHTRILNHSQTAWRAAEGWNTGYHLFDNPTGTLVIDGARAPIDLPEITPEILVTHLMEGIGIALDVLGNRMFVTDLAGSVYSADLDGKNERNFLFAQGNLSGVAYAEI